ncbi:MAG: DUF4238 domain-containing protein [Bacteroidota bacterium]|nr:DUF4238 domain-containing protein [Bacteroidota bacterium]
MSKYRKQHVVSKTYLKHFSINSDGHNLFVIDSSNLMKPGIQKKNSGDRIFWEENYSDSCLFQDKKTIEKFFGMEIEPTYNKIIHAIEKEREGVSFMAKQNLINWVFYTKMRSPIWEETTDGQRNRYSQQLHLENFTNIDRFNIAKKKFEMDALNKRWTIYKSPFGKYWWTTDNPGYCIDLKKLEVERCLSPDVYCDLSGADSILFYPLTKKICLCIHAYNKGENIFMNLRNTPISFETPNLQLYNLINHYTRLSQKRLIISAEVGSLVSA